MPITGFVSTRDRRGRSAAEQVKARRARAQAAVADMQQASLKAGTDRMSLDDINAEIARARAERR